MKKNGDLTPEDFDRLLRWLDPDRERAALKYEKTRVRLIRVYEGRGCGDDAKDLADANFDRVIRKLKAGEVPEPYLGHKEYYFLGFVNNICHEYFRRRGRPESPRPAIDPSPVDQDDTEEQFAYLEECMDNLEEEERWLVIEYYRFDKSAKIKHRKEISIQLGIDLKTLRLRVYRIRVRLRRCIEDSRAHKTSH